MNKNYLNSKERGSYAYFRNDGYDDVLVPRVRLLQRQLILPTGRSVQGDIIKQDDKSLQISVDGVTMTYYADEIKDIDGKPFAAAARCRLQRRTCCPA